MDAQTRRRERRAEKQAQWKAANPLLVGVSAKPVNRPILSLNRKPKSRVESALNPIDLTVLAEYHEQIESNLQRIERKNQRTWYRRVKSPNAGTNQHWTIEGREYRVNVPDNS